MLISSCSNKGFFDPDVIVLGTIRGLFNFPYVYTVDTYGNGKIDNIFLGKLDSEAELSPDGKWIIYSTQYHEENPDIYLMQSDDTKKILVIDNQRGSFDPAWAPDSRRITYYARDSQSGIYIVDLFCLQKINKNCLLEPVYLAQGDSSPEWSPDGNRIAYEFGESIYLINSSGTGEPQKITPDGYICQNPDWSPDNTKIAFNCFHPDDSDIFLLNIENLELTYLTNNTGSNTKPLWSPDGSKIAFLSQRDVLGKIIGVEDTIRSNAIFLMDNDGDNIIRLSVRNDEMVLWFSWWPVYVDNE